MSGHEFGLSLSFKSSRVSTCSTNNVFALGKEREFFTTKHINHYVKLRMQRFRIYVIHKFKWFRNSNRNKLICLVVFGDL